LWLLDEAGGKLQQLTEHSSSDEWPSVSSDGDTVLFNSWSTNFPFVVKLSLRTRSKSQFNALQARNPVMSPDSQTFLCQVRENYDGQWRQAILSMQDGAIRKDNLPLPAEADSLVRWSPDGTALDYVDPHDSANIWRLSLASLAAHPLTHLQGQPISDFKWSPNGQQLAWVSSDIQRDVIIFHRGGTK
jgi:Tol biopolymer transport system component